MSERVQQMFHFMSAAQTASGCPGARRVSDMQAACEAAPGGLAS